MLIHNKCGEELVLTAWHEVKKAETATSVIVANPETLDCTVLSYVAKGCGHM